MEKDVKFTELEGKTLRKVVVNDEKDRIYFYDTIDTYVLSHDQDCCEHVYIESIDGDIAAHLPGHEILEARETYDRDEKPPEGEYHDESYTWSFYTIRTMRDTFTIRFFGSSNGYYGEQADLKKIVEE